MKMELKDGSQRRRRRSRRATLPRVKRGAANNEACNYKRKRRPKTQRWVVARLVPCLVSPCSAALPAPPPLRCHNENVHILEREKDDKDFLKRVALVSYAGWDEGAHE